MKGVLVVGVAWLVGCGAGGKYGDMRPAAARDLQCTVDEIEITDPSKDQQRLLHLAGAPTQGYARGCGKRLVYARMCRQDGSSCDWYSVKQLRVDQLLERAAFDLRCSRDKLKTSQLNPSTVGVVGCEQQATYVWTCPHNQAFFSPACTWVLNSDSRPAASAK
jgi:hypothetical protein